jgi:hypothetical protein
VEFLKEHISFRVGDYVLGVTDANTIFINGYSNHISLANLSKTKAIQEFYEMKDCFMLHMKDAKFFLDYVKNKNLEYNLVLDTGGGGIIICKERKGSLEVFV